MLLQKFLSRKISPEKSLDFLSQKSVVRPALSKQSRRKSFSLRRKLTSASTQKRRNTPRFQSLLFGKETVKTFFYKCSNSGRNESTPQTQSNVSWISSKAELEISFMKTRLEMWVWERGRKIDPAIGDIIITPRPFWQFGWNALWFQFEYARSFKQNQADTSMKDPLL